MDYDIPSIIEGYRNGFFLMAEEEGNEGTSTLGWYSSNSRALIPLDHRFRYPQSLKRVLNQNRFSVAINRDFQGVVEGCADRESTWISSELKLIYLALHEAGWAHSFETWQNETLAGGILGIVIGGAFIGESMFFHIPDGSKVAMVKLVERLREREFLLFDAQIINPHLARFGAYTIDDKQYQFLLQKAVNKSCFFL